MHGSSVSTSGCSGAVPADAANSALPSPSGPSLRDQASRKLNCPDMNEHLRVEVSLFIAAITKNKTEIKTGGGEGGFRMLE
jgi:hypothetical protein